VELGTRQQFSDIAATISEGLELPAPDRGQSFWTEVSG
jgi:phosphopentomutase